MAKEVGPRARKNHLLKYFDEHFASEEVEMLEDLSTEDFPSLKFQTKSRIITLTTDIFGEVSEDFRMRRGAGSKQDFLNKQTAYIALNTYLKLHFSEDSIVKENSFEESVIKIQTDTQIISLYYDFPSNTVYEKTRNRRNTKKKTDFDCEKEKSTVKKEQTSNREKLASNKKSVSTNVKESSTYNSEEDITALVNKLCIKPSRHKKLEEGTQVKNIYNEKIYTVLNDDDGLIRVIDSLKVTYLMTIADLEIIK